MTIPLAPFVKGEIEEAFIKGESEGAVVKGKFEGGFIKGGTEEAVAEGNIGEAVFEEDVDRFALTGIGVADACLSFLQELVEVALYQADYCI